MAETFNYKTQKSTNRNEIGKIVSIKPIYNEEKDPYTRVLTQVMDLEDFANKFPEHKIQVEVNAIPETTYKLLKEDFDHKRGFQDGAGKFFYSPTINSVIIVHKEI